MSFAVIDFETTGVIPERGDRVVEVGVVLTDTEGNTEEEWTTLVNPRRDIGAVHIHGITGADLLDAPEFPDIADHLLSLISGRTVVAHNATFDMRFLHAELARTGFTLAGRPPALCSMKWAGRIIGAAKLEHCCEALDIELVNAHAALDDARATAALLGHLRVLARRHPEWHLDVSTSAAFSWPAPTLRGAAPRTVLRGNSAANPNAWLEGVLGAAWIPGTNQDEASYLLTLDRALLDRHISVTEGRELIRTAEAAGLSPTTVQRLHVDYLRSVAQEALADGVVTEEERDDLLALAQILGFDADTVDDALEWARAHDPSPKGSGFALQPGDRIVFTGEMAKPRSEWVSEIVAAGLASGGVTKSTKAVVSADPDSMSGKARKARDYGLPVISEDAFTRFFTAYRETHSRP